MFREQSKWQYWPPTSHTKQRSICRWSVLEQSNCAPRLLTASESFYWRPFRRSAYAGSGNLENLYPLQFPNGRMVTRAMLFWENDVCGAPTSDPSSGTFTLRPWPRSSIDTGENSVNFWTFHTAKLDMRLQGTMNERLTLVPPFSRISNRRQIR